MSKYTIYLGISYHIHPLFTTVCDKIHEKFHKFVTFKL